MFRGATITGGSTTGLNTLHVKTTFQVDQLSTASSMNRKGPVLQRLYARCPAGNIP